MVETFSWIASSPNHCDLYPYCMILARGTTAGNMSGPLSQFI